MNDLYGFELIRDEQIKEINTRARLYRHIETGAELLSLENDDENKVFGVNFRTPPPDSTGICHILEHSVLGGSRKYPVKEPFVELVKGSLNTFLNAITYPDKTLYPVASQNLQDFYNLIDVYMDAVFFPLISPYTLMQEGWHYEAEDEHKPLTYKGVVFNEMKGAYSQPEGVLQQKIQSALYPDTTYAFDSGGDPAVIPDLTYESFVEYHQTYYHPSNARIYFYGDDDPEMRLVLMSEYLRGFEAIPVQSQIGLQKPFPAPRREVHPYEVGEDQKEPKSFITVNWMLPEIDDPELTLGLDIMEYVLIGSPASQLRKALIDSGLGEDLTGGGLDSDYRQMHFSTGMKGVLPENVEKVEKLVQDTLASLALNGVDKENIAAAINTLEFNLRENNTGSFPRGLALMLRTLSSWNYNRDPLALLAFEKPLNAVKARLEASQPYLEHLIEEYLINNAHRVTVILNPDPQLSEKRAAAERKRLDQEREKMSDEDVRKAIEDMRELNRRQEEPDSPEALMTIPMLEREDLDKTVRLIPIEELQGGQSKLLYHDLFTNGILYMDLGFNMLALPAEYVPYMPLFGRALLETGTKEESFVQLLQRIGRTTGGIRPSTMAATDRDRDRLAAYLFLRGKSMVHQAGDLFAILRDVLSGANLHDRERFRQMALEEKARLESRMVNAGHGMVNTRLRARFDPAGWAVEHMGGVSYLFFLRQLAQQIDTDWASVQRTLETIRDLLISGPNALCNITVDANSWQSIQPQVNDFLSGLPEKPVQFQNWQVPEMPKSEGLTIPSQVNYVGKGANLFDLGYELNGSSFVIDKQLNGAYLWENIRVKGGAYGGFATFDSHSGVFTYLSYRDPNLLQSLETYDRTSNYLKTLELDESELTKVIIGTIGDLDAYMLPDAKGFTSMRWYLLGTTTEERQKLRDEVLNTSVEDFHRFGEVLKKMADQGAVVVLGVEDAIKAAGVFDEVKKVI
jgi:presequence protease